MSRPSYDSAGSEGTGPVNLVTAYRKAQKAHNPDDIERWQEDDLLDTLSSHGTTTAAAIAFTERGREEGQRLETQEELAYALTDPAAGGRTTSRQVAAGMAVRRLTPTECERLQGFPDGWTLVEGMSDSSRYRMLGNAVCCTVSGWIARRMASVHGA